MATLNMSTATWARDVAAKNSLKSQVTRVFDDYSKHLTSCVYYNTLESDRRAVWAGADSDQFKQKLDARIASVRTTIRQQRDYVLAAIDRDYNEFQRMQSNLKGKIGR